MKTRKTMKHVTALLLALGMIAALGGCARAPEETGAAPDVTAPPTAAPASAAPAPETSPAPDVLTVTDHAGNVVEVPADVQRIVVCDIYPLPSVLAVFFDSAEKIVGMPEQSMSAARNGLLGELYPEILEAETGFIDGTSVNLEELALLEPDVVFYSSGSEEMGQRMREAGFAALAVSAGKWGYDAIETLENWIALLDGIFPGSARAAAVADYSAAVYDRVQQRVADIPDEERARLFFLFQYGESTITTSGRNFFGQWWAEAVGAVNVGEELDTVNSTPVSMEQVYAWDPDCILITNYNTVQPDDLYHNTVGSWDWSALSAIQAGAVRKMPLGMYRSYTCGADTPVTLLWLAKTVYPERFADVDILAETQSYYRTVFGIELTSEQAARIFAPGAEASAF